MSLLEHRLFGRAPLKGLKAKADIYLIAILMLHIAVILAGALIPLKLGLYCIPFFFFTIFLYVTNYKCVSHNFIHNPFFESESWNQNFSMALSVGLGMPQTLVKLFHENHHRYNSDMQDLYSHKTKDWSSLYRYSDIAKQPENFWSYTFKGIFRLDLKKIFAVAEEQGLKKQAQKEIILITLIALIFLSVNFYGFVFFFLPTWFLGQCAFFAQTYMEHFRAVPGNRMTDSVSCYSTLYNLIWFNNGYHQEHHYKPTVHWNDLKRVRLEMLPINERMVVKGSHWFNF
ncbi:MAG: fatty acid desaturase family protein [Bacteriovoracaceae bacterium]